MEVCKTLYSLAENASVYILFFKCAQIFPQWYCARGGCALNILHNKINMHVDN